MRVRDIMTTEVAVAEPEATIETLAALMKSENVGAIPIVDEDNDLTGILTDRDIVVRCIAEGRDPAECTAEEILSSECEVVSPDSEVDEAARMMADHQIRRLPVVEEGKLVGMVSLGDIAVKQGDEHVGGEVLEEVSQGVKQSRTNKTGSGAKRVASPRPDVALEERHAGGSRGIAAGESRRAEQVRSTMPGDRAELEMEKQEEGLRSDSSPDKQGIASRSAQEENRRQGKVVPFRVENRVRNQHVEKPGKRKKA